MSNGDSRSTGVLAGALAIVGSMVLLKRNPGALKNLAKKTSNITEGISKTAGNIKSKGILNNSPSANDLQDLSEGLMMQSKGAGVKSTTKKINEPILKKDPSLNNAPKSEDDLLKSIMNENDIQKKADELFKLQHSESSSKILDNIKIDDMQKANMNRNLSSMEAMEAMDVYGGIKDDIISATANDDALKKYEQFFTAKYDKYGVFGKNTNAKGVYDSFMGIDDELGFLLDGYKKSGNISKANNVENLMGNINDRFKQIGLNKIDSGGVRGSYSLNGELLRNATKL